MPGKWWHTREIHGFQSEIWTFTIDCDSWKSDSSKDSYRQLSAYLDGNYYTATGNFRFSIINPYGASTHAVHADRFVGSNKCYWQYSFYKGSYRFKQDRSAVGGYQWYMPGKMYLLKVINIGDHIQYLQFINKKQ